MINHTSDRYLFWFRQLTSKKISSAVSLDMLRAFVALSETLNLTDASDRLSATRQTVRRHITDLENILGAPLFALERQRYSLTHRGAASLASAKLVLQQVDQWARNAAQAGSSSLFLDRAKFTDSAGRTHFSQQHPISEISRTGGTVMKSALTAWVESGAQLEAPEMRKIKPFLVIYRGSQRGWICVEIGDRSAYAQWFGWSWSKSAIGRLMDEDSAGSEFNDFISSAYARIHDEGNVRVDHLFAHLPREGFEQPIPVAFQRLLMGCVFPDGSPALAVLVDITKKVSIDELDEMSLATAHGLS